MRNFLQNLKILKNLKILMQNFITISCDRLVVSRVVVSQMEGKQPTNLQLISNESLTVSPMRVGHSLDSILSRFCLASLILMTVGVGEMWGNSLTLATSQIVSNGTNKGKVIATTTHAKFTLVTEYSGGIVSGDDSGFKVYTDLPKSSTKYVTLTWEKTNPSENYTIKVTGVSFNAKAWTSSSGNSVYLSFNGVKNNTSIAYASLFGGSESDGWQSSPFSWTNANGFTRVSIGLVNENSKRTFNCHFKNFVITYEIIPGTPSVSPTTTSVDVTVDLDDKQTVDLSSFFSLANAASDFTYSYTASDGGIISGSDFYATASGEYTVTAQMAAKSGCHEASSTSSALTITVNKLDQTLTWDPATEYNMLVGSEQTLSVTSSGLTTFTYESDEEDVLSVDEDGVLTAKSVGTAHITVHQAGNNTQYNSVDSVKTFHVKTKDTPIFTPDGFNNVSTCNLKVGDKVTLGVSYVSDGLNGHFTASATKDNNQNILDISREDNTITIEALNEGSSVATFTQSGDDDIFDSIISYSFAVTKIANTLTVTADDEYYVEDSVANVISNKNSDATVTTSSSASDIAYYDVTKNKLYFPNSNARSFEDSTVSIIISQAATYKYTAAAETISVKIKKYENTLYINSTADRKEFTMTVDAEQDVAFTATNNAVGCPAITIKQDDSTTLGYAYYDDGTIYSRHLLTESPLSWTLSQAEDYKYLAGEATFTVAVAAVAEATNCYVVNVSAEKTFKNMSDDENIYAFSAPGDQITYEIKKLTIITTNNSPVLKGYDVSTGKWEKLKNISFTTDWVKDTVLINNDNIRKIKWESGGENNSKSVRNVKVTRKTYLTVPDTTITKQADGTPLYTSTEGKDTLEIDYSLANGGALKIHCDDNKFKFTTSKLAASGAPVSLGTSDCTANVLKVPVFYAGNATEGNYSADVLIYNDVYRDTVTITAKVVKRQQTITWNPESLTANTLDAVKLSASAVEKVIFSESSDIATISIVDGDTLLTFTGSGDVTVYADAAYNDDYYAAEQVTKTWNVSLTPTTVTTAPTIETFTSGTYTNSMIDASAAVAKDAIKNKEVSGTYALKTGEDVTTVGTREITLVFTPDNEAMYASSECKVTITVEAKEETFDPKAAKPWDGVDENTAIVVPSAANNVTITGTVYAYSVTIEEGASLTLAPGSALILTENIHKEEGSTFAEEDLVLNSSASDGLGVLVIGETATNIPASINFYSKATLENRSGGWVNQHIGAAYTTASNNLYANYYGCQIYPYDEATENWGAQLGKDDTMTPFKGYNLLRDTEKFPWPVEGMINMEGTLVSNENQSLDLYYKDGAVRTENFLANSWPAPIDITAFDLTENVDFVNAEQAIYIFNSGTKDQAAAAGSASATATSPGQYIALPLASVDWTEVATKVIPPLQGFSVYATGEKAKLNLNYKRLVYDPAAEGNTGSTPNKVRRRAQEEMPTRLLIQVEGESGYSDEVYVFERGDFSTGFDNGYDGRKMDGTSATPQLSAVTEDGKMAINCVPEMNGTDLSFKAGKEDTSYTLTFDYNGDETLYLVDNDEVNRTGNGVTEISNDNTYTFKTSNRKATARFTVTSNPSRIATGVENVQDDDVQGTKVRKIMRDGNVYLMYNGTMYDVQGKRVK